MDLQTYRAAPEAFAAEAMTRKKPMSAEEVHAREHHQEAVLQPTKLPQQEAAVLAIAPQPNKARQLSVQQGQAEIIAVVLRDPTRPNAVLRAQTINAIADLMLLKK